MIITKAVEIAQLKATRDSLNESLNRVARENAELKAKLNSRATTEVADILRSMSNMLEAASKTVLSLHNNL